MAETETSVPTRLPVTVQKPTPYTFDLGLLLAEDPNPVLLTTAENLEAELAAIARDGAQALVNQLLSTCPIESTPAGVLLSLPGIETRLPREKALPPPRTPTTWEKFAAKKGIKSKTAEQRKKMVYDEETGDWVPKWGYKGLNKKGEDAWIVEVDEKKERELRAKGKGDGDRGAGANLGRTERKEKVRRNERLQRANERKGRKNGGK
ncbi:hypothetical protein B7494_g4390 [Chlorociboria aeruginascens]|nr:hypothetical protein B7494_g4390 [Chlorociboria aeruginascens]